MSFIKSNCLSSRLIVTSFFFCLFTFYVSKFTYNPLTSLFSPILSVDEKLGWQDLYLGTFTACSTDVNN